MTRVNGPQQTFGFWTSGPLTCLMLDIPPAAVTLPLPQKTRFLQWFLQGELLYRLLFDIQQVVRGSACAERHHEVNQPQISPQNSIAASLIELFFL